MFPISYKHPKGQADLHCVFMKPHIHSSTCDRKVAGGEEPSAAELDLKQCQRVGSGWLSGDGDVLFETHWVLCVLSVFRSMLGVFLYLEFPFLPLIWREVPYPPRPCSSATRSLKLFLFSFPAGINSPIFSAPQNFTPILLQHSHCLPGRFGCLSAFPTWLWPLWAGDLYLTHFRFSLADAAHSPSYFLKGAECLTS